MNLELIADILGWMLVINLGLLCIGFLEITILKGFVLRQLEFFFGQDAEQIRSEIPKVIFNYKILIIVFNLAPYFAIRIIL